MIAKNSEGGDGCMRKGEENDENMEDYSNWLERQIGQTAKTLQKIKCSSTTNKLAESMKNTSFKPKTAMNSDGEEIIVELMDKEIKEVKENPNPNKGRDDDFEDIVDL